MAGRLDPQVQVEVHGQEQRLQLRHGVLAGRQDRQGPAQGGALHLGPPHLLLLPLQVCNGLFFHTHQQVDEPAADQLVSPDPPEGTEQVLPVGFCVMDLQLIEEVGELYEVQAALLIVAAAHADGREKLPKGAQRGALMDGPLQVGHQPHFVLLLMWLVVWASQKSLRVHSPAMEPCVPVEQGLPNGRLGRDIQPLDHVTPLISLEVSVTVLVGLGPACFEGVVPAQGECLAQPHCGLQELRFRLGVQLFGQVTLGRAVELVGVHGLHFKHAGRSQPAGAGQECRVCLDLDGVVE
mmetsp:Transcript_96086/g.165674  ORF Transcript_96086/g.165674 Transcript_96086/m.165674 type:complete len:295 (+) Transcript_96086:3450-4334(+)